MSVSELSPADLMALTGNKNDGFGGDGLYGIIVLFLLMGMMGNGFGGWGGNQAVNADLQRGFDQSAVTGAINGVQSSLNAIPTQLCGVTQAVNNGFATAEVADSARQMANMQQTWASQQSLENRLDTIAQNQQSCCCENRLALANLQSTILAENCADRQALSDGVRDILAATQAQTQSILTQMCNDKLDAKNEQILALQNQLNMANLQASQVAQTAQIEAFITANKTTTAA